MVYVSLRKQNFILCKQCVQYFGLGTIFYTIFCTFSSLPQLILVNPVCVVAYVVASWRFFNERVFIEENTLLHFFGDDYYQYQKRVSTGLPFIQGYKLEL